MIRTRLAVEGRMLFWPWVCVAASAVVPALGSGRFPKPFLDGIDVLGLWVGIPTLATLAFGTELQYGTLASLLGQPQSRSRIWLEKTTAMALAVFTATAVHTLIWLRNGNPSEALVVILWLAIASCSATYWTLTARSIIGGLTFSGLQLVVLGLTSSLPTFLKRPLTSGEFTAIGGLALAYCLLMLVLGRRKLLNFEASGHSSALNISVGESRSSFLRCSASSPTLNLVRKEIQLLKPVLLLMGIAVVVLAALTPAQFASRTPEWVPGTVLLIVLLHGFLSALVAGSISLGEEKLSGVHIWNITLPISIRRQWIIKLLAAVVIAGVCSFFVYGTARLLFGAAFSKELNATYEGEGMPPYLALIAGAVTFAAFWCASALKGTVRTVFWTIPVAAGIRAVYGICAHLGGGMFLGGGTPATAVVDYLLTRFHSYPYDPASPPWWASRYMRPDNLMFAWLALAIFPTAAVQSYRLWRSYTSNDVSTLLRRAVVLALVAGIGAFLSFNPVGVIHRSEMLTVETLQDVVRSVDAMRLDPATLDAPGGLTAKLADIQTARPLSPRTLAWLKDAPITVSRATGATRFVGGVRQFEAYRFRVDVKLDGGWTCQAVDLVVQRPYLFKCASPQGRIGPLTFEH